MEHSLVKEKLVNTPIRDTFCCILLFPDLPSNLIQLEITTTNNDR